MPQVISTAAAPSAIGPYSQAVRGGEFVFLSGQIALDPQSGEIVGDTAVAQTEQVMRNLEAVLGAAGCSFADVVKTTIYLADMASFADVNRAYGARFPTDPPARATVEASALPKGALVEIDCIAMTPWRGGET